MCCWTLQVDPCLDPGKFEADSSAYLLKTHAVMLFMSDFPAEAKPEAVPLCVWSFPCL